MIIKNKLWKRLLKSQFNKKLSLVENYSNNAISCASEVPFEIGYWPYEVQNALREDTFKQCTK